MPGPVFLRGEDVTLHPQGEDDVEFLQRLINHPDVWPSLANAEPLSEAEEREWLEDTDSDSVDLLVCADGERVGTIGLSGFNETWGVAELGYMIDPASQGNGYATDAARRLVRYAFEDRRLHKVIANVYESNPASQHVLEAVGFQQEGVLREQAYVRGERVDVIRYGLLASEWDNS
ncbi:GNAT family N-acetyltransferase [Halapricum desulfuricans]|uniref:Acetyltransferase, RimL family n=1 Tax=Halapricum desulfuricans TaxID=2841257 RepID=A0A897NYT3_9EURY|nr:GNAT family protein [Halapricum desulfuricans]QSG15236.1 Acetyltransferase, RimL family [Halapricum desulfuricans]